MEISNLQTKDFMIGTPMTNGPAEEIYNGGVEVLRLITDNPEKAFVDGAGTGLSFLTYLSLVGSKAEVGGQIHRYQPMRTNWRDGIFLRRKSIKLSTQWNPSF